MALPYARARVSGGYSCNILRYVWSRRNPHIRMNFFGIITFNAPYLPYVLFAFSLLLGNSVVVDFMGARALPCSVNVCAQVSLSDTFTTSSRTYSRVSSPASKCSTRRHSCKLCARACPYRWVYRTYLLSYNWWPAAAEQPFAPLDDEDQRPTPSGYNLRDVPRAPAVDDDDDDEAADDVDGEYSDVSDADDAR